MRESWDTVLGEKLWRDGRLTGSEIAERLGVTRSAVLGHMNRAGIRRTSENVAQRRTSARAFWTEARTARLKALWLDEGLTAPEAAAALGDGCTERMVWYKVTQLKLKRPAEVSAANRRRGATAGRDGGAPAATTSASKAPDLETVARSEAPPVDPAHLKTLLERGPRECAWPIGAPDPHRGQLFCARPTGFRQSYCPHHAPTPPKPLKTVRINGMDARVRVCRAADEADAADLTEVFA